MDLGFRSYAEKQASIREDLALDFASMWLQGVKDAKLPLPMTWPAKFRQVIPSEKKVRLRLERNKMRTRVLQYRIPASATQSNSPLPTSVAHGIASLAGDRPNP